jgi:hypothetical protein
MPWRSYATRASRVDPVPLICVALAVCLAGAGLALRDLHRPPSALLGERAGFSPGGEFPFLPGAQLDADLEAMARSGTSWLRVDFPWTSIERQRGVYDWEGLDRVTAAAADAGLRVLALPAYTPAWARPPGCDTDKCPPRSPDDYAAFVAAAAQRFGPERVQAWELWNEPNIPAFWRPAPDVRSYAELLSRSAARLKAVRPKAYVLSGGLSPAVSDGTSIAPVTFLQQLYGTGALAQVDAVAVHPYTGGALPLEPGTGGYNTFLQLEQVREVMVRHGDAHKPVWGTEFGIATGTDPRGTNEARQALVVEQGFAHLRSGRWPWLQALFAYSLRDSADDQANWQANFGLLRHDGSPKPAFHVLSRLARQPLARDAALRPPILGAQPPPSLPAKPHGLLSRPHTPSARRRPRPAAAEPGADQSKISGLSRLIRSQIGWNWNHPASSKPT